LTDPERHGGNAEDAFDVVIPSIPGYAFSQHPRTVGLTPKAVADRFRRLMDQLGYAKFAVQGGDWGDDFRPCSLTEPAPRDWASYEYDGDTAVPQRRRQANYVRREGLRRCGGDVASRRVRLSGDTVPDSNPGAKTGQSTRSGQSWARVFARRSSLRR
jgi:hypothetical protein